MLALYEKPEEIHPELNEAPNLISKDPLVPISLIPLTEDDQVMMSLTFYFVFLLTCLIDLKRAFSGNVNSDTFMRGRGGSSRGRSAPPRGRGRGRGDVYSRSMSQTDDGSGPPYSRGGSRDYNRRDGWEDRGFGRGELICCCCCVSDVMT